jgi:hypothetical protein
MMKPPKSFKLTTYPTQTHLYETKAEGTQTQREAHGGYEKQKREGELEHDDEEATVTGGPPPKLLLLLPRLRRLLRLFSPLRSGRFLRIPNFKLFSVFFVFLESISTVFSISSAGYFYC